MDDGEYKWQVEACKSCGILTEGYLEPGEDPNDWHCHNCYGYVEKDRLRAQVAKLKTFILSTKRSHQLSCESLHIGGEWCTCGADTHNAKIDKVLACGS